MSSAASRIIRKSDLEQLLVIDEHDLDHHYALAASRTITETTQPPESTGTGPKRPAVEVGSFPHAFHPMSPWPRPLSGLNSDRAGTVVGHLELDNRVVVAKFHRHLRGAGVLQRVREGLLRDAVEGELDGSAEAQRVAHPLEAGTSSPWPGRRRTAGRGRRSSVQGRDRPRRRLPEGLR